MRIIHHYLSIHFNKIKLKKERDFRNKTIIKVETSPPMRSKAHEWFGFLILVSLID